MVNGKLRYPSLSKHRLLSRIILFLAFQLFVQLSPIYSVTSAQRKGSSVLLKLFNYSVILIILFYFFLTVMSTFFFLFSDVQCFDWCVHCVGQLWSSSVSFLGFTPVTAGGGGLSRSAQYYGRWEYNKRHLISPAQIRRDSLKGAFTFTEGASFPKTFYSPGHIWPLRDAVHKYKRTSGVDNVLFNRPLHRECLLLFVSVDLLYKAADHPC